ncbi:PREDICTED: uncharacterized protein LOC108567898 [Nicrophorus vespilloides]|uniref:Uncharacterized protein LOC108567898 n=1 Tax=Nicrophorus vespilloides TaxID=110193 RepID=A0ABM1NBA5_NICVS|nr:PREDICTED: uncharacterized protein LOC108567898 [Nicrophorus vespilloides]
MHLVGISAIFLISESKYCAINGFLKGLVRNDLTPYEKYILNKKDEKPPILLDEFPDESCTVYQKILNMHNEITIIVRSLNNVCGYDLTMYMAIVTFSMLSFIYDICNDLALNVKGVELPPRTIYAPEYWSLIGVFVLMIVITSSSKLMDTSNETKIYLHQLRNTYPQLQEHVESFSLQLMQAQLKINAAKFFTIHVGIMYNLASAWITYIIIFMQLDTDIATVDND